MEHEGSSECSFSPRKSLQQLLASCPVLDQDVVPERVEPGSLRADAFDLLDVSGGFDPMPVLPDQVHNVLAGSSTMFREAPGGLNRFEGVKAVDRPEYAKLVARQLISRKVELGRSIKGGGTIFGVGKKDSEKLREVWHGNRVSSAACRPPRPRRRYRWPRR